MGTETLGRQFLVAQGVGAGERFYYRLVGQRALALCPRNLSRWGRQWRARLADEDCGRLIARSEKPGSRRWP